MHPFRVLVVDDEEDFVWATVKRLVKRGVKAEGLLSGEKVLELIKKKRFDVILLDIKMPGGMDGIETLREIKKISPLTEVILLTGHASVESSIDGMKLGAFDYLLKPVKLEALIAKLAEAFEKKAQTGQKIQSANIQSLFKVPERGTGQGKDEEK